MPLHPYILASGWQTSFDTWTYSSADSPTFVISINNDVTTQIGVGDRIKLTQTTAKYFIVTAVGSYSGGATLVTVYGGTDYTLANAAITSPYFSHVKNPFGFPGSPDKWTVTVTDNQDRTQTNPTAGTWYNLGSISISVPIGAWRVSYMAIASTQRAAAGTVSIFSTLSTANNSESTSAHTRNFSGANTTALTQPLHIDNVILSVSSKTTYYLNAITTTSSITSITFFGASSGVTTIKLECAYL